MKLSRHPKSTHLSKKFESFGKRFFCNEEKAKIKTKVLLLLGYCGKGYHGWQVCCIFSSPLK